MPTEILINNKKCLLNESNRINVRSTFGPRVSLLDRNGVLIPLNENGETDFELTDERFSDCKLTPVEEFFTSSSVSRLLDAIALHDDRDKQLKEEISYLRKGVDEILKKIQNNDVPKPTYSSIVVNQRDDLNRRETKELIITESEEDIDPPIVQNEEKKNSKPEMKRTISQKSISSMALGPAPSSSSLSRSSSTLNLNVVKEGYLEKKGSQRRNWKKRYFILSRDDKTLYYYKKGDQQKKPKGVVKLGTCKVISTVKYESGKGVYVQKPLFFAVQTDARDFIMRANTLEEKNEWLEALKMIANN